MGRTDYATLERVAPRDWKARLAELRVENEKLDRERYANRYRGNRPAALTAEQRYLVNKHIAELDF